MRLAEPSFKPERLRVTNLIERLIFFRLNQEAINIEGSGKSRSQPAQFAGIENPYSCRDTENAISTHFSSRW